MLFKRMFVPCPSDNNAIAEAQLIARLSNLSDRELQQK